MSPERTDGRCIYNRLALQRGLLDEELDRKISPLEMRKDLRDRVL